MGENGKPRLGDTSAGAKDYSSSGVSRSSLAETSRAPTAFGRPVVIGLTGNIGCGKSTVARMLRDLGAEIIDADKVARKIMAPPGPVYEAVVREFGPGIVAADGSIDRQKLGQIVFSDPAALRRLDALV